MDKKLVEVTLMGLILDPISKSPVMIIKPVEKKFEKVLPIWIGMNEAAIITNEIENVISPRPMVHDLLGKLMDRFNGELEKVIINDIVDNTYFAELYVKNGKNTEIFDCRPSDAVALALKKQSRIFITDKVYNNFDRSGIYPELIYGEERIERWFNSINSEDLNEIEQ